MLRNTTIWRKLRHKLALRVHTRENSTFTGFLRLPTQFDALAGPVAASIATSNGRTATAAVTVMGCSNGAEAFTIASILKRRCPDLRFRVKAYDIDPDCIRQATSARYRADEIYNNHIITAEFVQSTFDRDGDLYVIKPEIAELVEFAQGNVLDVDLASRVAGSDIVFAQNFLFHLTRDVARLALENLLRMAKPGAALFIDGTDLDLRYRFVRRQRLIPLDFKIEEIHNEARRARAVGWPYSYWGLEPFLTYRRDWRRRYATILLVP